MRIIISTSEPLRQMPNGADLDARMRATATGAMCNAMGAMRGRAPSRRGPWPTLTTCNATCVPRLTSLVKAPIKIVAELFFSAYALGEAQASSSILLW